MSIRHNKYLNSLLDLFINCISARSAAHILIIKVQFTSRSLSFLITGLSNSSANSLLGIILFLIDPSDIFLSETL